MSDSSKPLSWRMVLDTKVPGSTLMVMWRIARGCSYSYLLHNDRVYQVELTGLVDTGMTGEDIR